MEATGRIIFTNGNDRILVGRGFCYKNKSVFSIKGVKKLIGRGAYFLVYHIRFHIFVYPALA